MTKLQRNFLAYCALLYCTLLILNLVSLSNLLFLSANALDDPDSGTISLETGQSFLDFSECNHIIGYTFIVEEPGVTHNLSGETYAPDEAWGNDITVMFYNVPGRYAPKEQYLNNIKGSTITGQVSTRHISFGLPVYEDSPFFIEPVNISYEIIDLGEDCNMDEIADSNTQNPQDNDKSLYNVGWGFLKENYLVVILFWFLAGIIIGIVMYKDAEKRGKNGFLWGVIGFILAIVGFVIWLVIRPPIEPPK